MTRLAWVKATSGRRRRSRSRGDSGSRLPAQVGFRYHRRGRAEDVGESGVADAEFEEGDAVGLALRWRTVRRRVKLGGGEGHGLLGNRDGRRLDTVTRLVAFHACGQHPVSLGFRRLHAARPSSSMARKLGRE